MAKTKKKDVHIRKFLTTPGEADSYVHVSYWGYGSIDFKLADCNRSVNIGFSQGSKESLKKALGLKAVIDQLVNTLQASMEEQG